MDRADKKTQLNLKMLSFDRFGDMKTFVGICELCYNLKEVPVDTAKLALKIIDDIRNINRRLKYSFVAL